MTDRENSKLIKERLRISLMHRYEDDAKDRGFEFVLGIDEAGRGPLCGPVEAACCCLDSYEDILYINDSKKLTEAKREALYGEIIAHSGYGIGSSPEKRIDEINILNATYEAMFEAYNGCVAMLSERTGHTRTYIQEHCLVLVDGNRTVPQIHSEQLAVVKGDANSVSIAAASILAKVSRDRLLYQYDEEYPEYGFAKHKGYGTAQHIEALKLYGPCPVHRRSFLKKFELSSQTVGRDQEEKAAGYLKSCGFTIFERNFRSKSGEIDIICGEEDVLCFTEVKYRSPGSKVTPAEAVTKAKQHRIIMTAKYYIMLRHLEDCRTRFDVLEIIGNEYRLIRAAFSE